jgi:hypothetical protein
MYIVCAYSDKVIWLALFFVTAITNTTDENHRVDVSSNHGEKVKGSELLFYKYLW